MGNDKKFQPPDHFTLDLHFDTLVEFAQFVSIIRGEKLDDAGLRDLTAQLTNSTKALQDAEHLLADGE